MKTFAAVICAAVSSVACLSMPGSAEQICLNWRCDVYAHTYDGFNNTQADFFVNSIEMQDASICHSDDGAYYPDGTRRSLYLTVTATCIQSATGITLGATQPATASAGPGKAGLCGDQRTWCACGCSNARACMPCGSSGTGPTGPTGPAIQQVGCGISCGNRQCAPAELCLMQSSADPSTPPAFSCIPDGTCQSAAAQTDKSYCTRKITALYNDVLGRDPDAGGLSGWVGQCTSGAMTTDDIAKAFKGSAEYQQGHSFSACTSYVTGLYRGLLGREPDAGGMAGWVNSCVYQTQSLGALRQAFLSSAEYKSKH